MELLGPSLHSLAQRHIHAARKSGGTAHSGGLPHLGAYARGMLAALEGLHAQVSSTVGLLSSGGGRRAVLPSKQSVGSALTCPSKFQPLPLIISCASFLSLSPAQGLIHNDVKPANFTVVRGFDPASLVSGSGSGGDPRIFLIDFGFTLRCELRDAVGSDGCAWQAGLVSVVGCMAGTAGTAVLPTNAHQNLSTITLLACFLSRSHRRWAPEKAGEPLDFVGTPDFAASTVLLARGLSCFVEFRGGGGSLQCLAIMSGSCPSCACLL